MRRRHPAIAASALGLAGALLPATTASAATPDRVFTYSNDVTVHRPDGSTYECQLSARLQWHLGEATPRDDTLFASTSIQSGDFEECEVGATNVVTLRWFDAGPGVDSDVTYTREGKKAQQILAPPAYTEDGAAYEHPSSEHRWVFDDCVGTCEFTHTFTPK